MLAPGVRKAELSLIDAETAYGHNINTEILELEKRNAEVRRQLSQADLAQSEHLLTAPASGIVVQVMPITVGQPVTTGQELLSIVPDQAELEIKMILANRDLAGIELGDDVRVKIDAYPSNQYGAVSAQISHISAAAIVDDQGGSVFHVTARLRDTGQQLELKPGLSVVGEIITGDRSLLQYLTDPVVSALGDSLKE